MYGSKIKNWPQMEFIVFLLLCTILGIPTRVTNVEYMTTYFIAVGYCRQVIPIRYLNKWGEYEYD